MQKIKNEEQEKEELKTIIVEGIRKTGRWINTDISNRWESATHNHTEVVSLVGIINEFIKKI